MDGVDLLIGGEETTHLMRFEQGELDVSWVPFPSLRRLTNDPRWLPLMKRETLFGTENPILNTTIPPMNDML